MGMPRGIRNHNPFNIRQTHVKWDGEVDGPDNEFEEFSSAAKGLKAGYKLLLVYHLKHGIRTIRTILNRYAPASENNLQAYIGHVARLMRVQPDDGLDLTDFSQLVQLGEAIILHENGQQPYTLDELNDAAQAAVLSLPKELRSDAGQV